jgi:HEAT repeat protein
MTDLRDMALKRLSSPNPRDRSLALVLIGREREHQLIDQVIFALRDSDPEVRAMAAWALDLLGSPQTIPALVEALHDATFDVRSNAGWALVHIAQRFSADLVVPEMAALLEKDRKSDAGQMAFLVLLHIGTQTSEQIVRQYRS